MIFEEADEFEKTQDAIVEVRYEFIINNNKKDSGIDSWTIRAIINKVADALNTDWELSELLKENSTWVQDYLDMTNNCANDPDVETTSWQYTAGTSESGIDSIGLVRCFNKYLEDEEIELMMNIIERLVSKVSQVHNPRQDSFPVVCTKERETISRFHTRCYKRVPF